ncbi:RNA-binding protein 48 [Trichonephila clavipes]|nr:RNA-binding protein 48 [Trichonephila clavipes]
MMSNRQYGETSNNQTVVKQSSINTLATQPVTYIWAGKEYTEYPKPVVEDAPIQKKPKSSPVSFVPRQIKSSSTCATNSNGTNICLNQGSKLVQRSLPHISESSYQNTITDVRNRISKVRLKTLVLLIFMNSDNVQ